MNAPQHRRRSDALARSTVLEQLPAAEQRTLVDEVRCVCQQAPLVRPVARGGAPMRVRVTAAGALGWVGDGEYRYDAAQRDGRPWPPIPARWLEIANRVGGAHPWDSAIVNWYEPDAALGWHRDQAERDRTKPIVTISLGDAASWAVRRDEDSPLSRTRLESGDVTLLAGGLRLALHSIERIIAAPMFSPLSTRGRISITLRVAG